MNKMDPSAFPTSANPRKPLSELFILSCGNGGTSWFLNSGRHLAFHNYKNEPAIYNLEITNHLRRNTVILRAGDSKKVNTVIRAEEAVVLGEYVINGPKGQETMKKHGMDILLWDVPSSLCPTKDRPINPNKDPDPKISFQWMKIPREKGIEATFAKPDWKLLDLETGEVHAVFVEKWAGTTERGQIQFRRSFGEDWELSVLVSVGIVAERERARRDRRGNFLKGFVLW